MKAYVVEAVVYPHSKEYWFRIKGSNGRIILTSETYKKAKYCRKMARKFHEVIKHSIYREIPEREQ